MAAGATVARQQFDAFRAFMNDVLETSVTAARSVDALMVEGSLTARGATIDLVRRVEMAGPFGAGNPEPVLAFPNHRIVDASVVGADHVRARLQSGDGARLDAIAFRAMGSALGPALLDGRGRNFHIAARLGTNFFRGSERVETRIVDIGAAGWGARQSNKFLTRFTSLALACRNFVSFPKPSMVELAKSGASASLTTP